MLAVVRGEASGWDNPQMSMDLGDLDAAARELMRDLEAARQESQRAQEHRPASGRLGAPGRSLIGLLFASAAVLGLIAAAATPGQRQAARTPPRPLRLVWGKRLSESTGGCGRARQGHPSPAKTSLRRSGRTRRCSRTEGRRDSWRSWSMSLRSGPQRILFCIPQTLSCEAPDEAIAGTDVAVGKLGYKAFRSWIPWARGSDAGPLGR